MHSCSIPSFRRALAVILVLALLGTSVTTGVGASDLSSTARELPGSDTGPQATDAGSDCVDSVVGFAYDRHFTITCEGSDPADVTIQQHDGWAYVTIVELPQDYEGKYVGGKVYWRSPTLQVPSPMQTYWKSRIPLQNDEAAFVRVTQNPKNVGSSVRFWEPQSRTDHLDLEPGTYRVEVWGYGSHMVSRSNVPEGEGMEVYDELVSRAPKRTSSLTLEIGGCDENFDAAARLNDLDRRQLETIKEIAAIRAKWRQTRRATAVSAAGGGALLGLGIIGAVEVGGAVLAGGSVEGIAAAGGGPVALSASAMDVKNLALTDEIERRLQKLMAKRRTLQNRYEQATARLGAINEAYANAVDKIRRCNSGQYEKPDGYQPITAEDRADAKRTGREGI